MTTIATKYRDFQYRLLTGSIVTNYKLQLWKIQENANCTFCNTEVEDELHLFCQCTQIQEIWKEIKNYIKINDKHNTSEILQWRDRDIILNTVHPKAANVINFLVLISKQYIYRCRCLKQKPNKDCLLQEIENIQNMEFRIANYKGKLIRHVIKWSTLMDFDETNQTGYIQEYLESM